MNEKKNKNTEVKKEKTDKKPFVQEDKNEMLVRIMGNDIIGSRNFYTGLTKIKGVSWSISNAACIGLGIPRNKRISELSKDEIAKIEKFLKEMPVADFLKNRRTDIETGESRHFIGSDLDIKKEFDIKRLKEIKSYRGIRHSAKLPSRGQRTRSHFRTKGKAMGVKRNKK